jgi:hypothetical protein
MEFKTTLQYLLENKYIVMMAKKPVVTTKFEEEALKVVDEGITIISKALTKPTTVNTNHYTSDTKKKIWNEFIEQTEIPHRIKTTTGTYTVRQYSIEAANKLIKILGENTIDQNEIFRQATKNYYKTVSYPILLSRYLKEDAWVLEVKEFVKKPTDETIKVGTNRFED